MPSQILKCLSAQSMAFVNAGYCKQVNTLGRNG